MNSVVYRAACFMLFRAPDIWRWSHTRHHTDTIIVGRDPEIATMRPPAIYKVLLPFVGYHQFEGFRATFRYALGGPKEAEKSFVPESQRRDVSKTARVWLGVVAATLLAAVALQSVLPLFLVGVGPSVLGSWHFVMTGLLQHAGMADNVIDHRQNMLTVYLKMNYHVEHRMFPMVPYLAPPRLHDGIKSYRPDPNRSMAEGLAEVIGAPRRQLKVTETGPKRCRRLRRSPTRWTITTRLLGSRSNEKSGAAD